MARLIALLIVVFAIMASAPAQAQISASEPEELVLRAEAAIASLGRDATLRNSINRVLPGARAVLIIPTLIKGGFIIGGEGGTGVLLARSGYGAFSAPAFVTMGAASVGLQIGAKVSETIFIITSENALRAILEDKVKLGGDISVVLGPIGAGAQASTTTAAGADIWAFARSQGLFGGGAFEGAFIQSRPNLNAAYYGRDVDAATILGGDAVDNAHADPLRAALANF